MNREELVQLIATTLDRAPYYSEDAAPEVVDELRPVLERIWDDGYDAGFAFGNGQPLDTPNPYREIN